MVHFSCHFSHQLSLAFSPLLFPDSLLLPSFLSRPRVSFSPLRCVDPFGSTDFTYLELPSVTFGTSAYTLNQDENSRRFGRSGQFRTAVTSESALLQLPDSREKKFGFPVDHSDIAKFSERYSGPYKIALRYLQIFEKGAPEAVSKRFGRIELLYPRQETSQSWHES